MVDPDLIDRVLRRARVVPWIGRVWRLHQALWPADDPGGSLVASGRWNRGTDLALPADAFPVLYTATSPAVADWELIRHARLPDADAMWQRFVRVQRSWLDVSVPSALDLREPASVGLGVSDLVNDEPDAYLLPQAIAAEAYTRGLTGVLAPSATHLGQQSGDYNVMPFYDLTGATRAVYGLIVPETRPRTGVSVEVRGSETPQLDRT